MALKVKQRIPVPRRSPDYLPQLTYKREQRKKSIRKSATTFMVLAVIFGAAGIGYTWYMGKNKLASANQPAPVYTPRAVIQPPKIASDAPVGAAVQYATPEAKPGENVSVTVRTNPEADCQILVLYNKVKAVDSGLAPKAADEFGVVSWSWTISPSAPIGTWPAEVTCKNKIHSAVVKADIAIKQ